MLSEEQAKRIPSKRIVQELQVEKPHGYLDQIDMLEGQPLSLRKYAQALRLLHMLWAGEGAHNVTPQFWSPFEIYKSLESKGFVWAKDAQQGAPHHWRLRRRLSVEQKQALWPFLDHYTQLKLVGEIYADA